MQPYIFVQRNGAHIIDFEKTQKQLHDVLPYIKDTEHECTVILFVSTKLQARELVKATAIECGMPYLVSRWIGGTLTNFDEIKKLIKKYNGLKEKMAKGAFEQYTKKEQLEITREIDRMSVYLEGLATLDRMPDALFVPAEQREKTAITED